jgi:histone-lysine N-methyltransferase SETMAR
MVKKGVFFLHDNARVNEALATQKRLAYLCFQCLDHPPYSPEQAPSDYHKFPGLKEGIDISSFFVQQRSHCCLGDLVERTTF